MTPQERDLLSRFLDDLSRAAPGAKDAEAAQAIERALTSNPDAAYVLVQHAILADQSLLAAQQRIAELQQAQAAQGPGQGAPQGAAQGQDPSFLGAAFGKAPPNPSSGPYGGSATGVPPTGQPQGQPYGQQGYPQQGYPQQGYGAPPSPYDPAYGSGGAPGPFSGGGGLGSFLRGAGTTAAGVAGGAFLFEGLSGLFGGHHGGGFGGGGYGFGGGAPVENVTVNEYGDDRGGRQGFADDNVDYDSDNGDSSGDDYS